MIVEFGLNMRYISTHKSVAAPPLLQPRSPFSSSMPSISRTSEILLGCLLLALAGLMSAARFFRHEMAKDRARRVV